MKPLVFMVFALFGLIAAIMMRTSDPCKVIDIITPNGQIISVETARNMSDQRRGLSFRQSLEPNNGMLFLFSSSGRHSFWMKDTFIPLDIIWLKNHIVVDMKQLNPPYNDVIPRYTPEEDADAVLEIPANQADEFAIQIGSQLQWTDTCHSPS